MLEKTYKWAKRCLGWVVLGCVILGALYAYVIDRRIGYGTVEMQATWRGRAYPLDRLAGSSIGLRVGGKRQAWRPGRALRLRPGPVVLELQVKHFHGCSATANVSKNAKAVAEFKLEAEPGTISIQNVKSNAVINGEPCGVVWVLRNAEVGRGYRIEAKAPGYYTNAVTLQIESPGEDLVTNLVWRPLMGFVRVTVAPATSGAAVSIDGMPLDPVVGGFVQVGVHSLAVSGGDYYPYSQRIEVTQGVTNHCQVLLKPKPALLAVHAAPAVRYQVHDGLGRAIAVEAGTAELTPGTNNLTIAAKGCLSQQREFVVEPNRKYTWEVEFEREGLQAFKKAKMQFERLKDKSDLVLLGKYGGREWDRLQNIATDAEDLVEGAERYSEACRDLTTLVEKCQSAEKEQARLDQEKAETQARIEREKLAAQAKLDKETEAQRALLAKTKAINLNRMESGSFSAPSHLVLTGITSFNGKKRALIKGGSPGRERSFVLAEGERDGDMEVVTIDGDARTVTVVYAGVESTLSFDSNTRQRGVR